MAGCGRVYLVGAGPGDPELITLRGVRCLQEADIVLYDYLVNPEILRHAAPAAECICLGGHAAERRWSVEQIRERLVAEAVSGRVVVRLKSGDPMVFGRIVEETFDLVTRGIPFEIVPGISAAVAAASVIRVPITHRELASAVAWVTAHEANEKNAADLDYAALAKFPGTLVFYMGVTTAPMWTGKLMAAGKPPETPVYLVRRCTWPDQQVVACRLDEVIQHLVPRTQLAPPVVALVGPAAGLALGSEPATGRALAGQRVVVTRPLHQSAELSDRLKALGADVVLLPGIEIVDPPSWEEVDRALQQIDDFDIRVFCSQNGVERWLRRAQQLGVSTERMNGGQWIAVGPSTAQAIRDAGIENVICPPENFRAESVVDLVRDRVAGQRVLLVRASRGRDHLRDALQEIGAEVTQVVTYASRDVPVADLGVIERLRCGPVPWITVTSSATAEAVWRLLQPHGLTVKWVSLSPLTSASLRACGVEPSAEAREATTQGLVEALIEQIARPSSVD